MGPDRDGCRRPLYVGSTGERSLKKRLSNHLNAAKSYRRESPWHVFLREMFARGIGKDAFSIEQRGQAFAQESDACVFEAGLIDDFNERAAELGYRLFNVGSPTKAGGDVLPAATIAKMQSNPYRGPIHDADTGEEFESIAACARAIGVSKSIVSEVVSGKRKTGGGRRLVKGHGFSVAVAA